MIVCHGALDEIGNRGANLAGGFGDVDDEERVDEEKKDEDDDFVMLGEPDNDGELEEADASAAAYPEV